MKVTPAAIRDMRRLAQDVVELDGEQDEAPSLADMARRARALLAGPLREQHAPEKRLELVGPTKEDRDIERAAAWDVARALAFARAGKTETSPARCEFIDHHGCRCRNEGTDPDHIFGGALRADTERHGAAAIQVLCRTHHDLKTANCPTRAFWLDIAEAHILRHGLKVMLPYLARARALLEGKRRG